VRSLHLSRAHIQRRASKLVDSEQLESNRRSHNIYNRIHRSHFVEMHFFYRHVVNSRFRFRQSRENSARSFRRPWRKSSLANPSQDNG
jgi:hypothetical protein